MLLLQIIVIVAAARLCGFFAVKIGQPAVIGEIVAGILLGPSLFSWDRHEHYGVSGPRRILHDRCMSATPAGALSLTCAAGLYVAIMLGFLRPFLRRVGEVYADR